MWATFPSPSAASQSPPEGGCRSGTVIHAITIDTQERVVPNLRTIRQLFRDILSRCEALHIQRIAIPALATGAAGVDAIAVAESLAKTIRAHTANPTILRSIVLPIPSQAVFDAFGRGLTPGAGNRFGIPKPSAPAPTASDLGEDTAASDVPVSASPVARGVRAWFAWRRRETTQSVDWGKAPSRIGASREPGEAARLAVDSRTTRPLLDGRYVLLEEIGRGGMAVVHLAWDLVLRRTVAIKILRPDCADPQSLRREAATAFELTHHGIVRMYHFEPAHAGTDAYS